MSNGWKVYWAIVAVTITNYLLMILWSLPKISQMAGGRVPFDMRPGGYSFEEAMAFVTAIDASGREFYLNTQHVLDSIYPALLSVTLAVGMVNLLPRCWGWVMAALSVAAGVFDLFENAIVARILNLTPEYITPELISTASSWTLAKSVSTTIASVVLIAALAVKMVQRLQNRKSQKE